MAEAVDGPDRLRSDLTAAEFIAKLLWRKLDFPEKRWGEVTSGVVGKGRRAAIRMAEEDVAPLPPSDTKSQLHEHPLDVSEGNDRKTTHRADLLLCRTADFDLLDPDKLWHVRDLPLFETEL